jgi:hypothetical protein
MVVLDKLKRKTLKKPYWLDVSTLYLFKYKKFEIRDKNLTKRGYRRPLFKCIFVDLQVKRQLGKVP